MVDILGDVIWISGPVPTSAKDSGLGFELCDDLNTSSSIDTDVRSNVRVMPGADADELACVEARMCAEGSSTADVMLVADTLLWTWPG